jgi:hypothetical protein
MSRRFLLLCLFVAAMRPPIGAQPVVAPTPQAAGSPLGDNAGPYNITNSWEMGYRFHDVDGNRGKYRSDVNFGNGIRLLGGTLGVHSRDGKGRLFDEILLSLRGIGNDPYQFSSFRIQKNALYRYDLLWRSNEFFNPALTISGGDRFLATNRQLQDHDVTLLPQGRLRILLGYSQNGQTGAGLSTGQWFDSRGDEFRHFANVRRMQREYRAGAALELKRWKMSVTRGWETFKDDTNYANPAFDAGANPDDRSTLNFLRRDEPVRGRTPYWRGYLRADPAQSFSLQGRFTHSDGQRSFVFDELARGAERFSADRNRQLLLAGNGSRVVTTGYLTMAWHPSQSWTVTNQTGYHQTRMEGDGRYSELNNGDAGFALVSFQSLGIRNLTNASETSWQPRTWIGLFGNYQVSQRRIRSVELMETEIRAVPRPTEQFNRQHAGAGGIRLQPLKPLRVLFSAETGRNDRPFYPTSDKDYQAIQARADYRGAKGEISASYSSFTNTNSANLFVHSSTGRTWAVDGGWTPVSGVRLDAGYHFAHLDTLTGLAYFADFALVESERSYYLSRLHTLHAGAQVQVRKRVDFYAGFVRTQDRAATPQSLAGGLNTPATLPLFAGAQVFPVAFVSPQARVSVVLRRNLRWNAGWQYYDYSERLLRLQDYSAHTGFVSLSYSF